VHARLRGRVSSHSFAPTKFINAPIDDSNRHKQQACAVAFTQLAAEYALGNTSVAQAALVLTSSSARTRSSSACRAASSAARFACKQQATGDIMPFRIEHCAL
jgi:hypothetical protein